MKAQASRMALSHKDKGRRHKYRCSNPTGDSSYQKDQNKKKYKLFLANLARHVTKKRKTSDGKKRSSKNGNEQFSIEEFNYKQFCNLQVSNSDNSAASTNSDSSWPESHLKDNQLVEEQFNYYSTPASST